MDTDYGLHSGGTFIGSFRCSVRLSSNVWKGASQIVCQPPLVDKALTANFDAQIKATCADICESTQDGENDPAFGNCDDLGRYADAYSVSEPDAPWVFNS
eukprot:CAMPEP_0172163342 /NCGR_PEP_ID=MMETSP1050-20130122/7219_1 /TAXON_ID=233186 /ORGANISM="Cryptomonas curvata, Strain CCAP979/52" /LENGTH=99 /DNA_ID=CAMNT_0012833523 /DNA_START=293 /DNA_END=589 /DNA_ORIENTATION=+